MMETNNNRPYPRQRILSVYTCLGGILGGFILYIIMALFTNIMSLSYESITVLDYVLPSYFSVIVAHMYMMVAMSVMGGVVGLIPALLTACIITASRIYASTKSFVLVFVIGTMVSALFSAAMGSTAWEVAVTGGFSALILALFTLPKKDTDLALDDNATDA
ncbi:hypothetical protein [Psychrobacter sp. I-STPA6b]|uniref:hypothetical protein n=1 Tax=Psychrobacter sp. I-STPA6b TaxID=2585718 RepID=UPI001D0C91B7|nr:hypothetical protein [Psychrobacter sp. I-STPA6b]